MAVPQNIEKLGLFQQSNSGQVTRLKGAFPPLRFRGTNIYPHLDPSHFHSGNAISPGSDAIVNDLIEDMAALGITSYYLNVGLEPTGGYGYVMTPEGTTLLGKLATQLRGYQQKAVARGAHLDIVVRYASEMNISDAYSAHPDPTAYKDTLKEIRKRLNPNGLPPIRLAYSPALSFQTVEADLSRYFPEDAHLIDVISCTWYINGHTAGSSSTDALRVMKDYFLHRLGRGKPFGIDEIGGWDGHNSNDIPLAQMFSALAALSGQVRFDYVTVFLENAKDGKANYNLNPTLNFLRT